MAVLKSPSDKIMVLAAPGAGKTKLVIAHACMQLKKGKKALLLTFSKPAADELKERIVKLGPEIDNTCIDARTFHSKCLEIVNRFDGSKKLSPSMCDKIIWDLVKIEKDISYNSLQHQISDYQLGEENRDYRLDLIQRYKDLKAKKNIIDYGDLHPLALNLIQDEKIRDEVIETFDWLYVDEGHDLNRQQIEFLKMLNKGKIFLIMSPEQSIYGFRGAKPNYLLEYAREIDAEKHFLTLNFRSGKEICAISNSVMMVAERKEFREMQSANGNDSTVKIYEPFTDSIRESEAVADEIFKSSQDQLGTKEYTMDKNFVIYRLHRYAADIERSLAYRSIPYFTIGAKSFFQLDEVIDIVNYIKIPFYLKWGDNDKAITALLSIINRPFRWFSKDFADQFNSNFRKTGNVILALSSETYYAPDKRQMAAMNQKAQELSDHLLLLSVFDKPEDAIKFIRSEMRYDKFILKSKYSVEAETDEELLASLDKFQEMASQYATIEALIKFSEKIKPVTDIEDAKAVLMTAHAAKGKEANTVFVIGAQLFPYCPPHVYKGAVENEEERNLLFVALSRARERCMVSSVGRYAEFLENYINKLEKE